MAIYIWDVMAAEFGNTNDVVQVALERVSDLDIRLRRTGRVTN